MEIFPEAFFRFSIYLSVIFPGLSYRQMYRKFEKVVLGLLVHVTPSNSFRRILRSEASVYKSYFFQNRTAVIRKLLDIRFSYNHCNFSRACLLVKMASKTVTRSINIVRSKRRTYGFISNLWSFRPTYSGHRQKMRNCAAQFHCFSQIIFVWVVKLNSSSQYVKTLSVLFSSAPGEGKTRNEFTSTVFIIILRIVARPTSRSTSVLFPLAFWHLTILEWWAEREKVLSKTPKWNMN